MLTRRRSAQLFLRSEGPLRHRRVCRTGMALLSRAGCVSDSATHIFPLCSFLSNFKTPVSPPKPPPSVLATCPALSICPTLHSTHTHSHSSHNSYVWYLLLIREPAPVGRTQILRSLTVLSLFVLVVETSLLEWIYHSDALLADAMLLQRAGKPEQAIDAYLHVIKKDPWHSPPIAAVHVSHLALQHPWYAPSTSTPLLARLSRHEVSSTTHMFKGGRASAAFQIASAFQRDRDFVKARQWFRKVLHEAPECELARHALRAVSHWALTAGGGAEGEGGADWQDDLAHAHAHVQGDEGMGKKWSLEPPVRYVHDAFEGYAATYDASMRALGYRAPDMLIAAVTAVVDVEDGVAASGSSDKRIKVWDLGCGTGLLGQELVTAQRAGTWPQHWGQLHRTCVDVSERMLAAARAKGHYDEYLHGEIIEVLRQVEAGGDGAPDLVVAADVAPYMGSLDPLLHSASSALRKGGLLAFTIEGLEAHLPLPAPLQALFREAELSSIHPSGARDARGEADAHVHREDEEQAGRGWELLANGRIAHLRSHVEKLVIARGFEIAAVGEGPIRWQGGDPVEGHVFVLRMPEG